MEANDLLGLLRRLGNHWQSQKRDVPELFLVLDAWERGGALSFDVPSVARQLGTSGERLHRRLSRLAPLGVLYVNQGDQGSLHLVSRPAAPDRLNSHQSINTMGKVIHNSPTIVGKASRAERGAGAPRARGAGAQLRAPDCSVLENTTVLSSLTVLGPGKRVPFLAYAPEGRTWAWTVPFVAADLVNAIGGDLSSVELPGTLDAVYSAADYLGGAAHVLPVVEAAIAAPPGGSFKGWAHYLRISLPEHLTRRSMLDEYSAKQIPNQEREKAWSDQCDSIPELGTLEILAIWKYGLGSDRLLSPHQWRKEDSTLSFELAPHYPPDWRPQYVQKMRPIFAEAETITNLDIL